MHGISSFWYEDSVDKDSILATTFNKELWPFNIDVDAIYLQMNSRHERRMSNLHVDVVLTAAAAYSHTRFVHSVLEVLALKTCQWEGTRQRRLAANAISRRPRVNVFRRLSANRRRSQRKKSPCVAVRYSFDIRHDDLSISSKVYLQRKPFFPTGFRTTTVCLHYRRPHVNKTKTRLSVCSHAQQEARANRLMLLNIVIFISLCMLDARRLPRRPSLAVTLLSHRRATCEGCN